MLRSARPARLLLSLSLLLLALYAGCSDSTAPGPVDQDNVLDPGDGSFALKDMTIPVPWGPPVLLRLEGSNMSVSPADGTVSLDVRVVNLSDRTVGAPVIVWLSDFSPTEVMPINAEIMPIDLPTGGDGVVDSIGVWLQWGYNYAEELGDDGALAPGEASAAKRWIFHDPSLASFAFAARADVSGDPGAPRLGGRCFFDQNYNGLPDAGEEPFTAGYVSVISPGVFWFTVPPEPDGRYAVPIYQPGLYELRFESAAMTPWPLSFTTPNPLTVMIVAGPDGALHSYLDAHFGVAPDWFPPPDVRPIQFTELPPEALHVAPWNFLDASVQGALLTFHVGYSGCSPEHPFSLWMSGEFMESLPPRAAITLVNELDEDCDAYFEQSSTFDLGPLFRRYMEAYGPGELILDVHGTDGDVHMMKIGIALPDSSDPGVPIYPGGH